MITILGHFGGENTGDEAMLAGLLSELASWGRHGESIKVVTKTGELPCYLSSIPDATGIRLNSTQCLSALIRSRAAILCGGTHYHDDYAARRYLRHLVYLLRLTIFGMLPAVCGGKLVWVGIGVGPLKCRSSRLLTRAAISSSTLVTTRDRDSYDLVQHLAPRHLTVLSAFDLAALLPKPPVSKEKTIGVSVTHRNHADPVRDLDWLNALADELVLLLKGKEFEKVKICVIRGGDRESDNAISKRLADMLTERLGAPSVNRIELISYMDDPHAMLSVIATCHWFVATRYHSAVLAYMAGCNLTIFGYHRKLISLASEIGLSPKAIVDLNSKNIVGEIAQALRWCAVGNRGRPSLAPDAARERAMSSIRLLKETLA